MEMQAVTTAIRRPFGVPEAALSENPVSAASKQASKQAFIYK